MNVMFTLCEIGCCRCDYCRCFRTTFGLLFKSRKRERRLGVNGTSLDDCSVAYPFGSSFLLRTGWIVIVTTGNEIAGHTITQYLSIVRGIIVRSPTFLQGLSGGLKQIVGGNIESYAVACEDARKHAFELMEKHALDLGADAIIGMRYDATEFTSAVTEVLAYGTAVKLS
jgi:uncharacterized protein YbjQ (UPF0145 family)